MDIKVVGMQFRRNHHVFSETDVITLERESTNPYDPFANKVLVNGEHVAYVARECNRNVVEPSKLEVKWKTNWYSGETIVAATLEVH